MDLHLLMRRNTETASVAGLPPSETTSNPMMEQSFLSSPLETILESIDDHDAEYISLHDLIEAYNLISTRIRSQVHLIMTAHQPLPALSFFREHSSSLTYAFRRDLRRCIIDPSYDLRVTPPPGESFLADAPMSDHEIQYARDLSTLCHHSLRVISDVFSFTPLYTLFKARDIEDLLSTLMGVGLASTFPTPNASKTWSLVFWIIQRQKLPADVLSAQKVEISKALEQALNEEKGRQAKFDGLKAIHSLMKFHPELFTSPFVKLFPMTLAHLVSDDVECRAQAAYALSGFALAKIHASSACHHDPLLNTLREFVQEQMSKHKHSQEELYLPTIVKEAFASRDVKQSCWACVVLTCVVVLSDASIFAHPHSLKLCISSLEAALAHMYSSIRALHVHVWRSLVWAFSRLPLAASTDFEDFRGRVFKVVKQELKGGIGIGLVTALLGPSVTGSDPIETVDDVTKALIVVEELMAGERNSDPHDGLLLLNRLLGAVGTSNMSAAGIWTDNVEPPPGLLNGKILDAQVKDLKDVIRCLDNVKVDAVRPLSEVEVTHHWNALVDLWISFAEKELREPVTHVPRELLQIWQSLLLSQADLTQERSRSHLTASPSFTSQIAMIVTRFLEAPDTPNHQARHLVFVKQLWIVMKNVFSGSWLPLPAEFILATVLKHQYPLDDDPTKVAWCELCDELLTVGIPTLLHVVSTRSEREVGLEVTRQLWMVLARTWQNPDSTSHWENLISLLLIPLDSWPMTDNEFNLWEGTLRTAVSSSHGDSISSTALVEKLLQCIGEVKLKALISFPKGVSALFSYVSLSDSEPLLTRALFLVEQTLTLHYPPQPEHLSHCLEILRHIGEMISSSPPSNQIQAICAVEKPLCLWVADKEKVMLGSEYDDLVRFVYCRVLEALQSQKPSVDTLKLISAFLVSVFERDPPSSTSIMAFSKFWHATYHGIGEYRPFYSEFLKTCLLGFQDAYGGSIADGLSNHSESQKTRMSTVPDSQPPNPNIEMSLIYDEPRQSPTDDKTPNAHVPSSSPILKGDDFVAEPQSKRRRLDQSAALGDLEEYSIRGLQADGRDGLRTPSPRVVNAPPEAPDLTPRAQSTRHDRISPSAKGPVDMNEGHQRKKGRKTDSDLISRERPHQAFVRKSSVGPSSPLESDAQDTQDRKRKRISSWVTSSSMKIENMGVFRGESPQRMSEPSVSGSNSVQLHSPSPAPSAEEYDGWEAGVSAQDLIDLQRELPYSDDVPKTDVEDTFDPDDADGSEGLLGPHDRSFLSPSLINARPPQRQTQHRSQTAPTTSQLHTSPGRPPPLRRSQTTSARIHALERAYTVVANDGSQIPVEDLVHATAVVNRIHTALNEQIARRLAGGDAKSSAKP